MSRKTTAIVAALFAALVGVQALGLERTREQALEREAMPLSELKASSLLPVYIGSLFMGSFRAVAIDVLWIQMTRMREQERRYFETLEIMDLIAKLQPRNPEVWAYQAHDAAYNIANSFDPASDVDLRNKVLQRLDANPNAPEAPKVRERLALLERRIAEKKTQQEKWIRTGIMKLVEGQRHLPDNPYLKHQIAYTLWQKPTIRDGEFDMRFLEFIENDAVIQAALRGDLETPPGPPRPFTAFELSEYWYGRCRENIRSLQKQRRFTYYRNLAERLRFADARDEDYQRTQIGLNLHPSSMDGFRYHCRYLHGFLSWIRSRFSKEPRPLLEEARRSFDLAVERAVYMNREYPPPASTPLFANPDLTKTSFAELCRRLSKLCGEQLAGTVTEAVLHERLLAIRKYLIDGGSPTADRNFVLEFLGVIRRAAGGDPYEYNDDVHAGTLVDVLSFDAVAGDWPGDVDIYKIPPGSREAGDGTARPPNKFGIAIRNGGTAPLHVIVHVRKLGEADPPALDADTPDVLQDPKPEKTYDVETYEPVYIVIKRPPGGEERVPYSLKFTVKP